MAQAEADKTYDVSAEKFFRAVSEYEKYPEHVEGMKKVVVKRNGSEITADYELSVMSKDMSYSIALKEDAAKGEVSWTLIKSEFFKANNGGWKIEKSGPNECKVHYWLDVEFNFSVPTFLLKTMVKSSLSTMMNGFYERAKTL